MQQAGAGCIQPSKCVAVDALHQVLCKHFAQFNAPLVKAVDVPDCAADKNAVLVERQQSAQSAWAEFGQGNEGAGAVASNAVLRLGVLAPLHEGLRLCNGIDQQQVVVLLPRVLGLAYGDKFNAYGLCALVQ